MPQIDTTQDQNAYTQGVQHFVQGMNDLVSSQNSREDAVRAGYDPEIQSLKDQVSGFGTQILKLKGTLNNLPANVTARGNGMASAAQLDRQVSSEAAPLQANLANLGLAAAPLNDSLVSMQANKQAALGALSDKFARETTGFTVTHQAQLNVLLDKLQNDRTLNAADMQHLYDLAKMDKQYQQTLLTTQASANQNAALMALLSGGESSGGGDSSNADVGTLQRVPGSDNVTVGGWSGSREDAADRIAGTQDRNSADWQSAYQQITKEFPSTVAASTPSSGSSWSKYLPMLANPLDAGGSFLLDHAGSIKNILLNKLHHP